ncbi:MAG TPA: AI-2E family transporter [Burkholderiaceae bacterium]|nr:AI-2E family transporter [Burkholderiaceae bacterium]
MILRTVVTGSLLALALVVIVFAFDLALLLFAAVLLAVVLHGAANRLAERTKLPRGACLVLLLFFLVGGLAALFITVAPDLMAELGQLRERLPEAIAKLQEFVNKLGWLETAYDALPKGDGQLTLSRPGIAGRVSSALTSTVGAFVNIAIVVLVAVYLAADPRPYVEGTVRLFPLKHRDRARDVFDAVGDTLFHWLQGQLVSMAVVGLLVAGGLWALGVPLAGTLGFIAGLFEFVPNIGPILSGVPAALLGITVSTSHVLYVILLYTAVQTLESYFLTPMVMKRAISLPPALTIIAQLVGTLTAGWLGLLLATPLIAAIVVVVRKVYLESLLGEEDAANA